MISTSVRCPLWHCDKEAVLVKGLPTVWWLDLASPFGDSAEGIDWTLEIPDSLRILDVHGRPRLGLGPDAHRPHMRRDGLLVELGFRGCLPAESHRHPMTHRDNWCDLHFPLVVVADREGDGGELHVTRRAMGDSDTHTVPIRVLASGDAGQTHGHRRVIQPTFLPWFSVEEQEAIAHSLIQCGFTDCSLNWFDHGIPLLPPSVYAKSARILRKAISGVRIWIGGMPGSDTCLPRAQGFHQRPIPFLASPENATGKGADLVAAAERNWCETVNADGVMIHLSQPTVEDGDAMPAHCFSLASRRRFAQEFDLPDLPDPLAIRHRYPVEWVEFCGRQLHRLIEVARRGHGDRPLAICMLGPGGPYTEDSSPAWRQLGESANLLLYVHQQEAPRNADAREHWGYVRLGGTPQAWWERWNDPLSNVRNSLDARAACEVQLALSGVKGIRIGSWACLDGTLMRQLMGP